MPTLQVELSQDVVEFLKGLQDERGQNAGELLQEAVVGYFMPPPPGVPSPKTREELEALLEEALDDDSPRIPAEEVIARMRRMIDEGAESAK